MPFCTYFSLPGNWDIVNGIDPDKFQRRVLPALCQFYWYIIPQRFWSNGDGQDPHTTHGRPSTHRRPLEAEGTNSAGHTNSQTRLRQDARGSRVRDQDAGSRSRLPTATRLAPSSRESGKCTRCAIQGRVRAPDFAGILLQYGLVSDEVYRYPSFLFYDDPTVFCHYVQLCLHHYV